MKKPYNQLLQQYLKSLKQAASTVHQTRETRETSHYESLRIYRKTDGNDLYLNIQITTVKRYDIDIRIQLSNDVTINKLFFTFLL